MRVGLASRAAGIVLLAAATTPAAEYFVATTGSDGNTGLSWASPFLTISNAVSKATTAGDIVTVSNGTYDITAEIAIANGITVRSCGGGVYGGLANADAKFKNVAAGDYTLAKGSPCIDTGSNCTWIVTGSKDLAGNARKQDVTATRRRSWTWARTRRRRCRRRAR